MGWRCLSRALFWMRFATFTVIVRLVVFGATSSIHKFPLRGRDSFPHLSDFHLNSLAFLLVVLFVLFILIKLIEHEIQ
ncbi:hypothetical protein BDZ45DRAFT_670081 [Acephala macrosclerotiorum]|nr:hypothetical protein BDZ45DRAFT_670081 [Acephala macrosclerotiorum]